LELTYEWEDNTQTLFIHESMRAPKYRHSWHEAGPKRAHLVSFKLWSQCRK
jgi:hypothetical protein